MPSQERALKKAQAWEEARQTLSQSSVEGSGDPSLTCRVYPMGAGSQAAEGKQHHQTHGCLSEEGQHVVDQGP